MQVETSYSCCAFSRFSVIMSLTEICENAKMAREYALLGNYDTSLVYYQGVIQQIQKHIQQIRDDSAMRQEWHQVCSDLWVLRAGQSGEKMVCSVMTCISNLALNYQKNTGKCFLKHEMLTYRSMSICTPLQSCHFLFL